MLGPAEGSHEPRHLGRPTPVDHMAFLRKVKGPWARRGWAICFLDAESEARRDHIIQQ